MVWDSVGFANDAHTTDPKPFMMLPVGFWELESIYPSLCHLVGLDTSTM